MTDYFTKWVEALSVPNQEVTTAADLLIYTIISRFGLPREVHSDQGCNFKSQLGSLICKCLGVVKTYTTPYCLLSDGQTERYNQTLLNVLAKMATQQSN